MSLWDVDDNVDELTINVLVVRTRTVNEILERTKQLIYQKHSIS